MREAREFNRVSLAEQAKQALRNEILLGRVKPNERIDLKHYSEQWDISPTPLREAVKDLENAGLVEISPRRGVFVATLDRKDLHEIFELRIAIECMAIELAAKKIPSDVAINVHRRYTEAGEAAARNRIKRLTELDDLIHDTALAYCGNRRLVRAMESVRDVIEWSKQSIIRKVPNPFDLTLPEHLAICQAMIERDPTGAARAMRIHLDNTLARIDEHLLN